LVRGLRHAFLLKLKKKWKMKQREVQDGQNVRWQCVQAFAGSGGVAASQATEIIEQNGEVPVVCTPSGGGQTVRLKLPLHWDAEMSDVALLEAIAAVSGGRTK
jgi:hypothetical protein